MINEDFDKFVKVQNKHRSIYPGHGERGKNVDPKRNQRANTDKNVGASRKEIE